MRLLIAVLAVALLLATGASAYLLLQSCGVRLPFTTRVIGVCDDPSVAEDRARLERSALVNRDLQGSVNALERELGLMICKGDPPPPQPPPPPPPEPETPSGLDPDAFRENDISVMEGCWQLSSNYDVRDIRSNRVTRFRFWQICFDENGNGSEVMRATDGTTCEGPLSGRIGSGRLTMREPGSLQCDNGAEIFRRDITCSLDAQGTARCDTFQPEINGRGTATLRRAGR